MSASSQEVIYAKRIAVTTDYFNKVDSNDPSFMSLFTEDFQFFFPKGGVITDKSALEKFAGFFGSQLKQIKHDIDNYNYIAQGNFVVVEGKEKGELANGKPWPDGIISEGLFCNVFEFEGERIKRLHIYVDPDFASEDAERIKAFRGYSGI